MSDELVEALANRMEPLGYVRVECPGAIAAWRRQKWGTNRGLIVVTLPEGVDPEEFVHREKYVLGKEVGYFPVVYGLYIQMVLVGWSELPLDGCVDKIDNQRCIVQSCHLVDPDRRARESARTWGQFLSSEFHDAIEAGLDDFVHAG